MIYTYFKSIFERLYSIQVEAPWADQVLGKLKLLIVDVKFLTIFWLWLETGECNDDEQSRKWLRSMLTPLKVIWEKEHKGRNIFSRLSETWPVDVQDFDSVSFELEGKIQQTKVQIEGWCEYLMRSSMKCKFSRNDVSMPPLLILQTILEDFSSYGTAKIVPFKKQIEVLRKNLVFLHELSENLKCCTDSKKKRLELMNFVGASANHAACLTFLYWAKEANEESATEMNIVRLYMLHKFIACAPDVTALYIGILKSDNLQPSHSFLLRGTIASFVDFFFEHLATNLKDDFLILRDQLIFLFKFLSDLHKIEEDQEKHLIRSKICSLFHEDAYILLPIDVMKEDFSNRKKLLSDFMIKIEITNAQIRQVYKGFIDSWIRLEAEKLDFLHFVSVQRELSFIEKNAQWADLVLGQLQLYRMELRFLRVFLLCFATWDDTDEEIRVRLSCMITSLQGIWGKEEEKGLLAPRLHEIHTGDIADWHPLAFELETKFQLSKLEFEAWWVNLFHSSFQCKPSTNDEILKFLDSILENLNDLVSYRAHKIVPIKKQIETLADKLVFLQNLLKLTINCTASKELREFNMFVQVFANDAASLTFFYWSKEANDEIAIEINLMLSHMLQKIKPANPNVARLYFETLAAIYLQGSDSLLFGQTASIFVNFFIEDLDLVTPLNYDFQILHDEVIFLLTFLNDPPNGNAQKLICGQMDNHFWEGVYDLLPFDDMQGYFSKKKVLLRAFVTKVETVNAMIRHLYCEFPDLSHYHFPKIEAPGSLDFLLQNLRNLKEKMVSDRKYVPFAKYKIMNIEEEVVSLSSVFNRISELKIELNDILRLQVADLIHLTEHVISLCISSWFVFYHPIWYHMTYLSHLFDRIKVVKAVLEKVEKDNMYGDRCFPHETCLISTFSEQARASQINETVVGFEDEIEKIIGELTRGHKSLGIVSIVGMGGLGKTTLTKKVYGSSLVKCHFNVFAFTSISQDHNIKRLLLDILSDIMEVDGKMSNMSDGDLAHQLWKCLSRQKYLIVLDDIWNISVWNEVKSSFPDDQNGSRVMFTTRYHEVVEKCKIRCTPHHLRFLSDAESWELLQKKVFHNDIPLTNLEDIGKVIAINCKGLPLAIVVIAGLLARTERSQSWWSEVAERVVSYLSDEGCMKILELSYNHLPDTLKPCLLYLGAFREDMLIGVKKVIMLWIAEGFIHESKTKSLEDVAKEYFHELVSRSLIIISGRSSTGDIRAFRLHDLTRDFCRTKCENIFQLEHGKIQSVSSSDLSIYNLYRLSKQNQSDVTITAGSSFPNARSLLFFLEQYNDVTTVFPIKEFKLAKVLDVGIIWRPDDLKQLSSLVHLRHIDATGKWLKSVPSSISNLWNIGSLVLYNIDGPGEICLPETFWRMKSLRHVKVRRCKLTFSDGHEHEAYPKLDKVVDFSNPILCTEEDVERLLQRLPAVRKLGCILDTSPDSVEERIKTLDFHRKLESLKLHCSGERRPYFINFPSTLKKLTLGRFQLSWTAISSIAELRCLRVLKLQWNSFPEPRLEMEDVSFLNLKFFELCDKDLVQWSASTESFPCLEQLLIECAELEELPPCFAEISTVKRIDVNNSPKVESSALQVHEEQKELGNEVEVSIYNKPNISRRGLRS